MDGASILRIFFRIMLPMSKPAIATVGVLSFISSWNDYIWPLMVLTDSSKFSMQVAITAFSVLGTLALFCTGTISSYLMTSVLGYMLNRLHKVH